MIILGIETSCDETAVCLLESRATETGIEYRVLGSLIHSQIDIHKEYGGVFPMMAKRTHAENLVPLLEKLITQSGIATKTVTEQLDEKILEQELVLKDKLLASSLITSQPKIDAIAVTYGPGLEPALWVGINFAQALGKLWGVPVYPENHMEGHIVSTLINENPTTTWNTIHTITYPALAVLLSGGHTELVAIEHLGNYRIVGRTRDDAVGEAFDKVARILGLAYPGGPEVSRRAALARTNQLPHTIDLPRPMLHSKDLDFSFSGLKTAVLYLVKETSHNGEKELSENFINELCREFEDAACEVIEKKTRGALDASGAQTLIVGGGVIANTLLRTMFDRLAKEYGISLYIPTQHLSGDNALMIALAGSLHVLRGEQPVPFTQALGNLRLDGGK